MWQSIDKRTVFTHKIDVKIKVENEEVFRLTCLEKSSLLETSLSLFIQKIRRLNYNYYGNKAVISGIFLY